jgi:hypothetical protein
MKQVALRASGLGLIAAAAFALGNCGGGSSGAGPTQPVTPPPVTPTPTPVATADPPLSASCTKLPPGNPNAPCRPEGSEYLDIVQKGIRTLQAEQPQIFQGDQVLNSGAYYVGLIKILDRDGICAQFDGEELAVTNQPSFSEQFHVLTSSSIARIGASSYRTTCTPSVIPMAEGPLPPPPAGCPLPSSREVSCSRLAESQYYGDVSATVDQLIQDRPELFNFDDRAQGTDWPAVKDLAAYQNAVADGLTKKGYCAKNDGEEIQAKKGSNTFSEHFDINLSDKYVRKGPGIYRVTCYPAAF